jgi:hypothetical protein
MRDQQTIRHQATPTMSSYMRNFTRIVTRTVAALFFLAALPGFAQTNTGELRLKVTDPSGAGVKTTVSIVSDANQYHTSLPTSATGALDVQRLPFGVYQLSVAQSGFAPAVATVEIRSTIATEFTLALKLPEVQQSVSVSTPETLVDPDQPGQVYQIGSDTIQHRVSALPGRSIQDLVNTQPGWLYEGNAVLHPRGSEYQTQFVVDGIPLTDNRSPSFGPEIDADDVDSISIYTAGMPAEYGRKMGGVVELNTVRDSTPGFHGQVVLSGGSYDSAGAYAQGQYTWGKNTLGVSASGSMTSHYLNPVVEQNYSNTGTLSDFSMRYERDFTPNDRLSMSVRHEQSEYDIPNELIQQAAGQRQTANNIETLGTISYQHTFDPNTVADIRAMVRDNANNFNSNPGSTPIEVFQHNWFNEGYVKGTVTAVRGRHEIKAGFETDNTFLHENLNWIITNAGDFDPSTPSLFGFAAHRPDLEQSAFVEDLIHLGSVTISAGLRWDHYQLILNRQSVQPRFSIAKYFADQDLIIHFSYDRVFQTPSFENILLSSSTAAQNLNPISLQLPVEPSEGNYYEAGVTKSFGGKLKLDANYFRRLVSNYADDDQIDNTAISFPIAFRKAIIYGAEAKLEVPYWHGFTGFLSYSYIVGNAWNPVTGGLFLGDDAGIPLTGHFPDSQDQRNSVRGRVRYQVTPRFWVAGGIQFDSGLPFEFECDPTQTMQQCIAYVTSLYGQATIDRINFDRGRIKPAFQVNASVGANLYKRDKFNVQIQADGTNLSDVLNVIDFGGLFSGNAIGPGRSFGLRLTTTF